MGSRHHVNARRNHGGRVNQSRYRRRTFHGVRQPDIKRNLCGFADRSQDQEQRDCGKKAAVPLGMLRNLIENLAEAERPEMRDQQKHRQQKAEVSDAVDDEGFLAGIGR